MDRTVVYTRVSTEDQIEKYGLACQSRACREYAAAHQLEITDEIADEGISGTVLERAGLDRVRRMVRDGQVDVVLMLDADRLSRELAHLLILKPEIERRARLEFVAAKFEDSPSGRMFFGIRGVIAQYEREQTRERTMRGKRERARTGLIVGGRVAYGYRYDGGRLSEDPERAPIARRIFAAYDSGSSMRAITRELRESGAPTWGGKTWGHSSVRRILTNETYAGIAHYGTHRREGKILKLRESGERIALYVPALVSLEQWARVQGRLSENPNVGRPSTACLMRGVLHCAVCGRRMYGEVGKRDSAYRCAGRDALRHQGEPCRVRVNVGKLDAAVWETLLETFTDAEVLRDALTRRKDELRHVDPAQADQLRSLALKAKRREDAAVSALLDPDMAASKANIKTQYRAAVEERRRVEAELSALEETQRTAATTEEWIDETVGVLQEYMENLKDQAGRIEFIRRLVGRAEWNGEEVRMQCFIDPKLSTTS